jgi:hypothetical protein
MILETIEIKISQESNEQGGFEFSSTTLLKINTIYMLERIVKTMICFNQVRKQNDYWFHSRGSSGSCCLEFIIQESVPKKCFEKKLLQSQLIIVNKNCRYCPIVYTFKNMLLKRKGDPAGTVHFIKRMFYWSSQKYLQAASSSLLMKKYKTLFAFYSES